MTKNIRAYSKDDTPRARLRVIGDKKREREAFRWMVGVLKQSDPQLFITRFLLEEVDGVVAAISRGKVLSEGGCPLGFILENIRGKRDSECTCGRALLLFLGYLDQVLLEEGSLRLPLLLALDAMIQFQPEPLRLEFGNKGKRWWIKSTDIGSKEIGYRLRLPLKDAPPTVMFGAYYEAFLDLRERAARYT